MDEGRPHYLRPAAGLLKEYKDWREYVTHIEQLYALRTNGVRATHSAKRVIAQSSASTRSCDRRAPYLLAVKVAVTVQLLHAPFWSARPPGHVFRAAPEIWISRTHATV